MSKISKWNCRIWLSEFVFLVVLNELTVQYVMAICRQGSSTFLMHFVWGDQFLLKKSPFPKFFCKKFTKQLKFTTKQSWGRIPFLTPYASNSKGKEKVITHHIIYSKSVTPNPRYRNTFTIEVSVQRFLGIWIFLKY
jgi:hypothetical protein